MTRFNLNNIREVDLLRSIDSGEFDNATSAATLRLLAKWCATQKEITDLRFFRATVTQLWIIHHSYENDSPLFITGDQHGSLKLTPASVRSALVKGIEEPVTRHYDNERTEAEIRNIYMQMLAYGQGGEITLSPFGVKKLTQIHLSILQDAVHGNSRAKRGLH